MTKLAIAIAAGLIALAPAAAKEKKPVDPNKKICRAESSTGSIMPRQTCHTAAEWAQIDATTNNGPMTGDLRGQGGGRPAGFGN